MTKQNKCRWCGVEASKHAVSYPCGSWHTSDRQWSQGIACRDLGEKLRVQHEQTIEILQKRIEEAVKALQDITRHEVDVDDQFGVLSEYNEHGHWVEWDDVEDVIEILAGNSPTILEGSE
jgi:hypothetical protein